ncbi:hypothetical protein NPX13_g2471 [Xylaria arbuscula]|uniref:Uncharacterized protein n=1 Tax=Xylaria arbuscula TaxID=114810 RepID=A0A9W8NK49_9PEZI|nr:hypothetical protein NPX13_g2471 [Xylaria arbuscula]
MPPTQPITCVAVDFDGVGLSSMYVALDCSRRGDGIPTKFESFTNEQGVIDRWFRSAEPLELFQSVDAADYERISITFSTALYFGRLRTPWVTIQINVEPSEFAGSYVRLQFGAGNSTYSVKTMPLPIQPIGQSEYGLDSQPHFDEPWGWVEDDARLEKSHGEYPDSLHPDLGQRLCSTITNNTQFGLPRDTSSPTPLTDPPPPSPSLSVSTTLDTFSEVISPLTLPSPQLPVLRSLRAPRARAKRFSSLTVPSSPSIGQGRVTRSRKRKGAFEVDELEPPKKRRRLE